MGVCSSHLLPLWDALWSLKSSCRKSFLPRACGVSIPLAPSLVFVSRHSHTDFSTKFVLLLLLYSYKNTLKWKKSNFQQQCSAWTGTDIFKLTHKINTRIIQTQRCHLGALNSLQLINTFSTMAAWEGQVWVLPERGGLAGKQIPVTSRGEDELPKPCTDSPAHRGGSGTAQGQDWGAELCSIPHLRVKPSPSTPPHQAKPEKRLNSPLDSPWGRSRVNPQLLTKANLLAVQERWLCPCPSCQISDFSPQCVCPLPLLQHN